MQVRFVVPTLDELDAFVHISLKTYRETFEAENDPVEFEKYLAQAFHPDRLKQVLENSEYYVWLMMDASTVAGYCTLRDAPPEDAVIRGRCPIEIVRFYVDPAYQGMGLGKTMMTFCLEQARRLGADTVWLGVWEQNHKAQQFYKKQGFQTVGSHDFWVGDDCQNDFLMQKTL